MIQRRSLVGTGSNPCVDQKKLTKSLRIPEKLWILNKLRKYLIVIVSRLTLTGHSNRTVIIINKEKSLQEL